MLPAIDQPRAPDFVRKQPANLISDTILLAAPAMHNKAHAGEIVNRAKRMSAVAA